jgi:hypothetical protein
MLSFLFWQKWLLSAGIIIAVFGSMMVLASATPLFNVFNHQIDPVFWGSRPPDEAAHQFQHWIYAVWGATIAVWGIFTTFETGFPDCSVHIFTA